MACNDCEFYSFIHDECRKRAPLANGREGRARWPSLAHYDKHQWCGEFELDRALNKYRNIAFDADTFANDRPWDMTKDETAKWLTEQTEKAEKRVADLENR